MRIYNYSQNPKSTRGKSPRKFRLNLSWNWKKAGLYAFRAGAAGFLLLAVMFLYYSKDLPNPNKLLERNVAESTKIFARDGQLLYEIHGEAKRTLVELDLVSDNVKHATVAVEDKDFYKHAGISITGIIRSVIVDILAGEKKQGGSTITQQFVKNAILTKDKSWDRKIREVILAIAIDARFSKDEILKLYLNEIPYGRNAYGIEAASQSYFGKSANDLSLAESAYLAALPQAPTYYNPLGPNREFLDNRKNTVLSLMKDQGYITEQQQKEAAEEVVEFSKLKSTINAPHFTLYVQDYLAKKFGEKTLEEGGLKVYTTLDPRLQKIAEEAVENGVEANAKKYNGNNAALVAIDSKTGQIVAMVGSKDYFAESTPAGCTPGKNCTFEPNVNVALAERQPGSSFKPYAYVTAFKKEHGYAPASLLFDVTTNFGTFGGKSYIPQNYNGRENGPMPMRQALAGSLNIPAVKTLALVGVENTVQTARDLGITSPLSNCGLSLVLGGCEVKLLDHTAAYSTISNMGVKNEKTAILKIEDRAGKVLEEYQSKPKEVLDPQAAYLLIDIMTDNSARSYVFGSRSPLILPDRPVAAKTGTTQQWKDGWTVGFTPQLTAGVWVGNNNGSLLKAGADGVLVAAPIWNQFMKEAHKEWPVERFTEPQGIKKVLVDEVSGKLPTEYTQNTKTEVFASYSVPTKYDDVHIPVAIDMETGLPATTLTPPDKVSTKVYTVFHSERPDNPSWEQPVLTWALNHGYIYPSNSSSFTPVGTGSGPIISILEPNDDETIFETPFTVSISAASANPIARVDLSIDGQFVRSLTNTPYIFQVNKNLSQGSHTIAIKAVDNLGQTSDTSMRIIFDPTKSPVNITVPNEGGQLNFPAPIVAEGAKLYDRVDFYFQRENGGSATFIGESANVSNTGDTYQYSLVWQNKPDPGTYNIYAQTNTGKKSPVVKIIVP